MGRLHVGKARIQRRGQVRQTRQPRQAREGQRRLGRDGEAFRARDGVVRGTGGVLLVGQVRDQLHPVAAGPEGGERQAQLPVAQARAARLRQGKARRRRSVDADVEARALGEASRVAGADSEGHVAVVRHERVARQVHVEGCAPDAAVEGLVGQAQVGEAQGARAVALVGMPMQPSERGQSRRRAYRRVRSGKQRLDGAGGVGDDEPDALLPVPRDHQRSDTATRGLGVVRREPLQSAERPGIEVESRSVARPVTDGDGGRGVAR